MTRGDTVFLLSKSGSTEELVKLIPFFRTKGANLISITCVPGNQLARLSDHSIVLNLRRELCPFELSPATSPTLYSLFGDVCKGILLEQMDLSDDVLAKNHPASLQGRRLTLKVADIMCTDLSDCIVSDDIRCIDVVLVLNDFGGGFVVAIDGSKSLSGVFSDGDLRRAVKKYGHTALSMPIAQLMTLKPMTVGMNELAISALQKMDGPPCVSFLPVTEPNSRICGFITRHQILDAQLTEAD